MFEQSIKCLDTNFCKDGGQANRPSYNKVTKLNCFSNEYSHPPNGLQSGDLKAFNITNIPSLKDNSFRLGSCYFHPFLLKKHYS
jgi:hypothetical protein